MALHHQIHPQAHVMEHKGSLEAGTMMVGLGGQTSVEPTAEICWTWANLALADGEIGMRRRSIAGGHRRLVRKIATAGEMLADTRKSLIIRGGEILKLHDMQIEPLTTNVAEVKDMGGKEGMRKTSETLMMAEHHLHQGGKRELLKLQSERAGGMRTRFDMMTGTVAHSSLADTKKRRSIVHHLHRGGRRELLKLQSERAGGMRTRFDMMTGTVANSSLADTKKRGTIVHHLQQGGRKELLKLQSERAGGMRTRFNMMTGTVAHSSLADTKKRRTIVQHLQQGGRKELLKLLH